MKILVITYSFEVNPGTFLQAYGVQSALKEIFPEATIEFIRHKRLKSSEAAHTRETKKTSACNFLVSKIRAIPRRLKYEYYYRKCFKFTKEVFDFFDYDENAFKQFTLKYDLIVIGSDTILSHLKSANGQLGIMWLKGIVIKKILFSASSAPAKFSLNESEKKLLSNSFNSYSYLSVRDEITFDLLTKKIGNITKEVVKQMDPTYFIDDGLFRLPGIDKSNFNRILKRKKIVLLNFCKGFDQKEFITKKLKKNGFYVVSTDYNKDADKNIYYYSPFQWGALFKYISFTITDRFHDTVFSLRNNKNVFSVDWSDTRLSECRQSKCSDLLKTYGLMQNHFIIQNQSDVDNLIENLLLNFDNKNTSETIFQQNNSIKEKNTEDFNYLKKTLNNGSKTNL